MPLTDQFLGRMQGYDAIPMSLGKKLGDRLEQTVVRQAYEKVAALPQQIFKEFEAGISPVKQEQITRAEVFDQFHSHGPLANVMRTPHKVEGDLEQNIEKRA